MKEEMMVGLSAPGPVGRWGAAPPQAMLERMKDYGQEGAFALWDDLSPEERELLVRDIEVSCNCNCNARGLRLCRAQKSWNSA
jgi:UDP-N-acetylglucosamine/UDP-N-acetylgalactosamine diphosphorylase